MGKVVELVVIEGVELKRGWGSGSPSYKLVWSNLVEGEELYPYKVDSTGNKPAWQLVVLVDEQFK